MFGSQVNFARTSAVAMRFIQPPKPYPNRLFTVRFRVVPSPHPARGAQRRGPTSPRGGEVKTRPTSDRLDYSGAVAMRFIQPPKPYPNCLFTVRFRLVQSPHP